MAKLAYKPFGSSSACSALSSAGAAFKQLWKLLARQNDPPKAKERASTFGARCCPPPSCRAIFSLVKAAIDPSGARAFEKVTGTWPGD